MGLLKIIQACEAKADGWAAKRLSADELREALELDRYLKKHWGRVLAGYLGTTGVGIIEVFAQ